jgi:hypothetical protein
MAQSVQAQAASQIRKKLKDAGIKASVSSFSASMCNGVRIYCNDPEMARSDKVKAIAMPYQYGSFNSMEDLYEYDNENSALPQVKFVQISY